MEFDSNTQLNRRSLVTTTGSIVTVGVAGCLGGEDSGDRSDGEPNGNEDSGNEDREYEEDETEIEEENDENKHTEESDELLSGPIDFSYNAFEETVTLNPDFDDNAGHHPSNYRIESPDGEITVDLEDQVGHAWFNHNHVTVGDVLPEYKIELWWDDGEDETLLDNWFYKGPEADFYTEWTAGSSRLDVTHAGGDIIPIEYLGIEGNGDKQPELGELKIINEGFISTSDNFEIHNVEFEEEVCILFETGYVTQEIGVLVGELE